MGKQGPCRHCGVTSTPLWRNGPPEKPILCNACGSRWRTKGSLTNYTPLHCRGPLDSEEIEVSRVRHISFKHKEQKPHRKKQNNVVRNEHEMLYYGQNFCKIFEGEVISNRSSSGSVMSCSESCAQFGTTDASDLTGSAQSNVWDTLVPSKKRTCVPRPKPSSPIEKLTKDLYSILHEQQSSNFSGYQEEDLLYGCETPAGSVEIGHGGVLIRYSDSKTVEESEASSLPIDSKQYTTNDVYPGSESLLVLTERKTTSFSNVGNEKRKKLTSQATQGPAKRDQVSHEKLDILRNRDSPLSSTGLKDIAAHEVFMEHLTQEEQHRLLRYLPSVDNVKPPEGLRSMFHSPQFIESLSYFQKLLREGIFDLSFSGANDEGRRNLKRHVLLNLTKSKWVEHYKKLKDVEGKSIAGGNKAVSLSNHLGLPNLTPLKRSRDSQNQHYKELNEDKRSPKRASKSGNTNPTSLNSLKLIHEADDFVDREEAFLSPRSLFTPPPDRRSVLDSFRCTGEIPGHQEDILIDVPINSSFPEADLLFRPWDQKKAVLSSSFAESTVVEGDESLSNNRPLSLTSQPQMYR